MAAALIVLGVPPESIAALDVVTAMDVIEIGVKMGTIPSAETWDVEGVRESRPPQGLTGFL